MVVRDDEAVVLVTKEELEFLTRRERIVQALSIVDEALRLMDGNKGLADTLARFSEASEAQPAEKKPEKKRTKRKQAKKKPGRKSGGKKKSPAKKGTGKKAKAIDLRKLSAKFADTLDREASKTENAVRIVRRLGHPVTSAQLSEAFGKVGIPYEPRLCGMLLATMKQFVRVGPGLYRADKAA